MKDLLQHQFFAEEIAMSVDVTQVDDSSDKLLIRMKVHGEMKKKNGEEAIEFPYDLKTDKVEEVVGEMVSGLEEEEVVGEMVSGLEEEEVVGEMVSGLEEEEVVGEMVSGLEEEEEEEVRAMVS